MGQYMPSLCLLCIAMLVRALYLWVTIQENEQTDKHADKSHKVDKDKTDQTDDLGAADGEEKEKLRQSKVPGDKKHQEQPDKPDKDKTNEPEETEKEKLLQSKVPGDKKRERVKHQESSMSVVNIGTNYLFVHLLGYAVMNSPMIFSKIGAKYLELPSEVSVFYGLVISSIVVTVVSPHVPRVHPARMTREELSLVNILVLVELATVCLSLGMHNFSLGLVVAVVYTPLALAAGVVTQETSSLSVSVKRVFCLALHPLCVLTFSMMAYSRLLFPEDSPLETMSRGRDAAMQAIMFSIVDSMIYGNWLFNVTTTTLLPIWIIFWQILCNRVKR